MNLPPSSELDGSRIESPDIKRTKSTSSKPMNKPKELGLAFASAVTVSDKNDSFWVARNGEFSLFTILNHMMPEIRQPTDGRHRIKGKISRAEFNKFLQSQEAFLCKRTRCNSLSRVAGNWLFCNRRWLDPRNQDDLQSLHCNYEELCSTFPSFRACSRDNFLRVLERVCAAWSELALSARKLRPADCGPEARGGHPAIHQTTAVRLKADEAVQIKSDENKADEAAEKRRSFALLAGPAAVPASKDNAGEQVDQAILGLWAGDIGPLFEAVRLEVLERSASL